MDYKTLSLILLGLIYVYSAFLEFLDYRSANNPIPKNVNDVYDSETYGKWRRYNADKSRIGIMEKSVTFLTSFLLILFNAYPAVSSGVTGIYVPAIMVILLNTTVNAVAGIPLEYYDSMIIEERYGFNRKTKKTFVVDLIKTFAITIILMCGVLCAFIVIHQAMGDQMLWLFAAFLFIMVLVINFLYPVFSRIFNKFTPLEDGELKQKLSELLDKNGYKVRAIKVMDASKRTTKANAYFTGFGKMKTIVLYDNLLKSVTTDEICAVFAHEMGHGLHRDTLKNQILNFITICLIAVLLWLTISSKSLYTNFGFQSVNYGFALILMMDIEMALATPFLGLFSSWFSRRAEYRADRQAVTEGYGQSLISALKKLARDNFSNLAPSPLLVKLSYSHPTLSQRIEAIEGQMK